MGFLIADKPLSQFLHAQTATVSASKSFFTAIPQVGSVDANSNSQSQDIKVDVYIRDENGGVMPDRTVKLSTDLPSVTITPSDLQKTDNLGKAAFILKSKTPGRANISVEETTSGKTLTQKLSVEFTN